MKYLILFILFACASTRKFENKDVCFIVYDLKTKKYEKVLNSNFCRKQYPAASTFKIPLSLMAFDDGILKDEKTTMLWNKQPHTIEAWNRDQTAATWMKESVVWYSQMITPKLGKQKIERYLDSFDYGNKDFSGDVKTAWLTPAPITKDVKTNTLKISGYEQKEFLEKLWDGKLSVSSHALNTTKNILVKDINPPHRVLQGKTGSGFIDDEMKYRIGWYVAHLNVGLREFIVVTNFVDNQEMPQPRGYGGLEAKELTKQLLIEMELW